MRTLLTLAFIGFCSLVFAQKSETRALASKPIGISVSTGIQATLIKSNKNEVVLQAASSGQLNRMEAKIDHGVLVVRIKRNSNFQNSKSLKATIYINSNLESIDLSSAASLAIKEPWTLQHLAINLSSAASLKSDILTANKINLDLSSSASFTGALKAKELSIDASSASSVQISGSCTLLNIDANSSANINLAKLSAKTVVANARSAAKIQTHVTESLNADASTGANIQYTGQPKTSNFEKSTGGNIHNAN